MPRGPNNMELLPETTSATSSTAASRGRTFQFSRIAVRHVAGPGGLHLYKAGIDLLHSRYSSTSASRSVLIRRTDGTLARRLDFGRRKRRRPRTARTWPLTHRTACSLATGGMRSTARVSTGRRAGNYNLTPSHWRGVPAEERRNVRDPERIRALLRADAVGGRRVHPVRVGVDTRFAANGTTLLGPPQLVPHFVEPNLRTSRSLTWDLTFDHRFDPRWAGTSP
jgi:hypothetical protein